MKVEFAWSSWPNQVIFAVNLDAPPAVGDFVQIQGIAPAGGYVRPGRRWLFDEENGTHVVRCWLQNEPPR